MQVFIERLSLIPLIESYTPHIKRYIPISKYKIIPMMETGCLNFDKMLITPHPITSMLKFRNHEYDP